MDLATLVGIVGAVGLMIIAMLMMGDISIFINGPSFAIVLGGSFFATMAKFGLGQFLGAMKVAAKSFVFKIDDPEELIEEIVVLADMARKGGLLSLEGREINNKFLEKGVQLLVDGHDPEVVKVMMSKDRSLAEQRHQNGAAIFAALADVAPSMGLVGTIIGLVAMLSNMTDPKTIGPAMAVAMLTTLYACLMAFAICSPIADKLKLRAAQEVMIKNLIIDALLAIQSGQNPRIIDSMLRTYLPEGRRELADINK
jgi:chemotaxis protein MotA